MPAKKKDDVKTAKPKAPRAKKAKPTPEEIKKNMEDLKVELLKAQDELNNEMKVLEPMQNLPRVKMIMKQTLEDLKEDIEEVDEELEELRKGPLPPVAEEQK